MRSRITMFVCFITAYCGLATLALAAEPTKPVEKPSQPEQAKPVVEAGKFVKVYDPNIGEDKNEQWYVNDHCVIYGPKGKWHLFGITGFIQLKPKGRVHPTKERLFAHATAKKLFQQPWDKQPHALKYAPEKPWGEWHIWAPYVVKHDGKYYMFYCAGNGDKDHSKYKLHLATSTDCKTWTRHAENPMVVDGFDARDPFVARWGDKWVMYYTATTKPKEGNHAIVYVTSDDLIHWGNRGIAFTDPSKGKWGGPCESPQIVRRGDKYYLFLGPRNGDKIEYVGTDVYVSKDPFHWEHKDKVAHLRAHAPEIFRDVDGKWYISHCGWIQRGFFIAPLTWNDGLKDPETNIGVPEKVEKKD